MTSPALFQSFSQFGIVSDLLPFDSLISEKTQNNLISVSCERCVVRRSALTLKVKSKSDLLPKRIRAHVSNFKWTFASSDDGVIHCIHHGKTIVRDLRYEQTSNDLINSMLIIGKEFLLVGHESGILSLWNTDLFNLISSVNIGHPIKQMIHPATYVNKVVLLLEASGQDLLVLWNLKSGSFMTKYKMDSSVESIAQSPAVDVFAIGLSNGRVLLFNLKSEEILFALKTEQDIACSAPAFHVERSFFLAGRVDGTIDVFDLDKRRHVFTSPDEGLGRVTKIAQVAGCSDLFCAAYEGNALIHWIIDQQGSIRKVREKLGNLGPVTRCKFLTQSDKLYAVCEDHIVTWNSVICQKRSNNVHSRKKYKKPVIDVIMAPRMASTLLMPEWADTVILHRDCRFVSLARMDDRKTFQRKRRRDDTLNNEKMSNYFTPSVKGKDCIPPTAYVLCCDISTCCNFAVLGYSTGHIVVFNLQSREERLRHAFNEPVRAVAFDFLNRYLLIGGEQGSLQTIPFRPAQSTKSSEVMHLQAGITLQFEVYHTSNLFAASLSDGSVSIVSCNDVIEVVRTCRTNSKSTITCTKFSQDGRFLACSFLNCTLIVYDVISGMQLDCLQTNHPVISFDMKDDILVCACRGNKELFIYICTSFYNANIKTDQITKGDLLTSCIEQPANTVWRLLENIERILEENQPESAIEKPKSTPFFLPSIPTLTGFKLVSSTDIEEPKETQQNIFIDSTELVHLLQSSNSLTVINLLKRMSAVRIEYEIDNIIRTHHIDTEHSVLSQFVNSLIDQLESKNDFDFIAAVASRLTIKSSHDMLRDNQIKDIAPVKDLIAKLESMWQPIQSKYERSLCIIEFLKNDTIYL